MMNQQLRDYEDPEPRVPALPRYYDEEPYSPIPILSPPHTPVASPQHANIDDDEELTNLLSDSLMGFLEGEIPDFANIMSSRDFDLVHQAIIDDNE